MASLPSQPPDLAWMCWLCFCFLHPPNRPAHPPIIGKKCQNWLFSHHLEILCWTFLNHLLILNDCVDHTTVTKVDTENKILTILKFSGQIFKFVLILWIFPHYMENLCITFLQHLKFFVGYFLYITVTQIKIWNNNYKNLNCTFQILKFVIIQTIILHLVENYCS